jgi:hypothetical protein
MNSEMTPVPGTGVKRLAKSRKQLAEKLNYSAQIKKEA